MKYFDYFETFLNSVSHDGLMCDTLKVMILKKSYTIDDIKLFSYDADKKIDIDSLPNDDFNTLLRQVDKHMQKYERETICNN